MEESRQTTVLFADVSGSTKLYETAGDAAALTAIGRCIERMRKAAESTGGRVVKTIGDRKSTRLNSSHSQISYAVFCLKKKKKKQRVSLRYLSGESSCQI